MQLDKRVWDFCSSLDLLHPGERVVVGVSGGPDSLALLDVLHTLAARQRLELHVAHLNHGLRAEAGAEADFVREQAEKRGCGYYSESLDVAAVAAEKQQSLETAARELRYAFFGRAAQRASASLVAVAHTADDQAETVLMHLLRGAGLRGLRGMRPRRALGDGFTLIRPFLQVTRAQVLAYCAEHSLEPRFDSSNADVRYLRNRVRRELLPALEAYNPNIRAGLARTAEVAGGDYDLLREAVQAVWQATVCPAEEPGDQVAFDRERWAVLGLAQQRALLREAVARLMGQADDLDFAPLEAAVHFSRWAGPGRSCQVLAGLSLRVERERIVLFRETATEADGDAPRMMAAGELGAGWTFACERLGPGAWSQDEVAAAPRWTAYVDAARLAEPVELRSRRPGDRFQPLGMQGVSVKLSDYLVNKKIPARRRGSWPLATCVDEIVWVMGLRLDERFKVKPNTSTVVRMAAVRTVAGFDN